MTFRPTLACDASMEYFAQLLKQGDLLYASAKLDGIRATIIDGRPVSRTLKPIRNRHIQESVDWSMFEGLDGELIVGDAFGEGVFARTSSGVMSEWGLPDWTYWVFDNCLDPTNYGYRFHELCHMSQRWPDIRGGDHLALLHQEPIKNHINLLEDFEEEVVTIGYEGAIVRWAGAPYKQGRSTLRERYMMKLKRFQDSEARIIGFQELKHNENEATIDGRGLTTRGHSQANKRSAGMLGALRVVDLERPEWEFNVGTGFDASLRQEIWDNQEAYLGKLISYRYLPVGTIDLPRHPTFKGFRHQEDL